MPCTFTGSLAGDEALLAREALDRVTDLLCRTCRLIEKKGELDQLDPEVAAWWAKHKAEDAKKASESR